MFVGVVWLFIAFNMDTSVSTGGGVYMPDRVENLGLIARRQNHLMIAGLVTLIGTLLAIFGKQNAPEPERVEPAGNSLEGPPFVRDLSSDRYRLWLAERHGITRNDLFDRFVLDGQTYESLDGALAAAHATDIEADKLRRTNDAAAAIDAERDNLERREFDATMDRILRVGVPVIFFGVLAIGLFNYLTS